MKLQTALGNRLENWHNSGLAFSQVAIHDVV